MSEAVAENIEPSHPSAENPQKPGLATVTTATTAFPGNGGDAPGLSWRAIDQITHEVEEWAYGRRHKGEIDQDDLEAEIRRRLAAAGIFPEVVEFEAERVLRCLFEGREARAGERREIAMKSRWPIVVSSCADCARSSGKRSI